jgi:hypothetical protein
MKHLILSDSLLSAARKQMLCSYAAAQQFIGREGETATFLSRCPLNSELPVGGFAPRYLSRWAFPDSDSKVKLLE